MNAQNLPSDVRSGGSRRRAERTRASDRVENRIQPKSLCLTCCLWRWLSIIHLSLPTGSNEGRVGGGFPLLASNRMGEYGRWRRRVEKKSRMQRNKKMKTLAVRRGLGKFCTVSAYFAKLEKWTNIPLKTHTHTLECRTRKGTYHDRSTIGFAN